MVPLLRRIFHAIQHFSQRLSKGLVKRIPGIPGVLAQWIPVLLLLFLIGLGVLGWIAQHVLRADKQEHYHYKTLISLQDPSFKTSTIIVGFPLVHGNQATILNNGDAIFSAMLRDIARAQKSVNLETFIIRSDKAGKPIIEALIAAARRGVQVQLLYDAVGSKLKKEDKKALKEAGVHLRQFRPLATFRVHKLSKRTHRKLLVVDGRIGYTGGIGLAEEWMGDARTKDEWRETQVRVQGPVVAQMQTIFAENWIYCTGEVLIGDAYYPELKPAGSLDIHAMRTAHGDASAFSKMLYYVLFQSSHKRIYITNPYFIPDAQIREALAGAAERGVDVQLLLPGKINDAKLIRAASWFHYGGLLKAGVRIFEYQPTMVHAKNVVVDGLYSTIGSINFDLRSMELNSENSLGFYDQGFASQVEAMFHEDKKRCREVTLKEWKDRSYFRRLIELGARIWEPYY